MIALLFAVSLHSAVQDNIAASIRLAKACYAVGFERGRVQGMVETVDTIGVGKAAVAGIRKHLKDPTSKGCDGK